MNNKKYNNTELDMIDIDFMILKSIESSKQTYNDYIVATGGAGMHDSTEIITPIHNFEEILLLNVAKILNIDTSVIDDRNKFKSDVVNLIQTSKNETRKQLKDMAYKRHSW